MSWLTTNITNLSQQYTQKVTQLTDYLERAGFNSTKYPDYSYFGLKSEEAELAVQINFGATYKNISIQLKTYEKYKVAELNILAADIILEFKAKVNELIVDVIFN